MKKTDEGYEFLHPLVADAGTQALPNPASVRLGKVWIPASAGMSGCGNSFAPQRRKLMSRTVLSCEAGNCSNLMFPNSSDEIVRHTDVQRTVAAARENIDVEAHELVALGAFSM